MPAPLAQVAAPYVVTDEQVRQFVDDGYLVIPRLLPLADVEALKKDTAAIARGAYPCESLKPMPADYTDQQVLENLLCIHFPHFVSPVMKAYATHPAIAAVLSRVVGAHLAHWDGSVKCMQSMLFVKPPGKPGQNWHQDEFYIPTRDRSLCGAWIAIDDANVANGCLGVIPGSHRHGYFYDRGPHAAAAGEFDGPDRCIGFDESKEVLVECPAGSVVFFNGYLLHRSQRNRSATYRRALVNHYMNSWSLLPWMVEQKIIKGETSVAVADYRVVMQVAGTDPYAWKGYEKEPGNVWLRGVPVEEKKPEAPTPVVGKT